MARRILMCFLGVLVFLVASLPVQLGASDRAMGLPAPETEINRSPEYIVIKSKEEIAYDLFVYALRNIGELRFINSYDEYLEAYKKAVRAVYSSGSDAPGSLPSDAQSGD